MGDALKTNTTLTQLDLGCEQQDDITTHSRAQGHQAGNGLGGEGREALKRALQANTALTAVASMAPQQHTQQCNAQRGHLVPLLVPQWCSFPPDIQCASGCACFAGHGHCFLACWPLLPHCCCWWLCGGVVTFERCVCCLGLATRGWVCWHHMPHKGATASCAVPSHVELGQCHTRPTRRADGASGPCHEQAPTTAHESCCALCKS